MRVIMFAFWGRKANIEIQLPYIHRILAENPDVEFHGWDLCRDPRDSQYVRSLDTSDRFQVRTEFYTGDGRASHGQIRTWKHYADRQYRDALFIKLDDDIVFIETSRTQDFINSIQLRPESIISARVINNGACTFRHPELWAGFQKLRPVIPQDPHPDDETASLLGVHRSAEYADMVHRWFFANWQTTISRDTALVAPKSWLSINFIGFNWDMCRRITATLGQRSPRMIFDRTYGPRDRVGDEGAVNMLPILIEDGLVAAHLNFGPQIPKVGGDTLTEYRKQYADIADQYLK